MSSQAPSSRDPLPDGAPASGGAVGDDWSRPLAEEHIALLGFLADVEREVLNAIRAEARVKTAELEPQPANVLTLDLTPDPGSDGRPIVARINIGDLGLALARVSRSLRLTIALRTKLIEDLKRADNGAAIDARMAADRAEAARPALKRARQKEIGGAIWRTADAAHAEGEGDAEFERITREANEKLQDEEVYGDLLTRPASEVIAHICRDLGLSPDWPRLAQERWARAELASGRVGAPLKDIESLSLDGRTRSEGAKQPAAGVRVTAEVPTNGLRQAEPPRSPPPYPPPSANGRAITPATPPP